jgi:uncharacterized protein (DUF427 family)
MTGRPTKVPDESHPIAVSDCPSTVLVKAGSLDIAETHAALTLTESNYGPVQYVPASDVDMSLLERSDHTTYCP